MKKIYYLIGFLALIVLVGTTKHTNAQTIIDTGAATVIGATTDSGPGMNPPNIRNQIRADLQNRVENNQNYRNNILDQRKASSTMPRPQMGSSTRPWEAGRPMMGSSTRPLPPGVRPPEREDGRRFGSSTMMGSTTPPRPEDDRRPMMGSSTPRLENGMMRMEDFKIRRDFVYKQFDVAINNLHNIRTRINARIQKEQQAGKDMSKPISLLAIADAKIATADAAVKAIKDLMPPPPPRNPKPSPVTTLNQGAQANSALVSSTTNTVNPESVKPLVEAAKKAIEDAQKSLSDVIVALAKAIGPVPNPGEHGSTTPPRPRPVNPNPQGTSTTNL